MGRRHARGFTYLLLLFVIALAGIGAARIGEQVQTLSQRDRERELLFRGGEIQRALDTYHARLIAGESAYPMELADLVEDRRGGEPQFHLRRLYADPFTGRPDWQLLRERRGGIVGVHSRSRLPAFHQLPLASVSTLVPPDLREKESMNDPARRRRVGDWRFLATGVGDTAVVEAPETRASDRW